MTRHIVHWPPALAQQVAEQNPVALLYLAVLRQAVLDMYNPPFCRREHGRILQKDAVEFLRAQGVELET